MLGLVIGLVAGLLHLTGLPVILGFGVLSYLVPYAYSFKYLQVEEESVETMEVFK